MGTSKSYSTPTGGKWTNLKANLTSMINENNFSDGKVKLLFDEYVKAKGATSKSDWSAASRKVAKKLISFVQDVGSLGLEGALEKNGLQNLLGQPLNILTYSLLDFLCENTNLLDEVLARIALQKTLSELLMNANDAEEVEKILKQNSNQMSLENILFIFFGNYIFEQFTSNFYESHLKNLEDSTLKSELKQINDFIKSLLKKRTYERNILEIDWTGREGDEIISEMQDIAYKVFGE